METFAPIANTLLGIAEIGGNSLLSLDDQVVGRCRELQGYCIEIHITDLDLRLFCHQGSGGMRLSLDEPSKPVDATISGRVMALLEALSRYTGDVIAFRIHQQARSAGDWFRQTAISLAQTSSEYLREESHMSPTQVEFERFQQHATALKQDVERAEVRLRHLLQAATDIVKK